MALAQRRLVATAGLLLASALCCAACYLAVAELDRLSAVDAPDAAQGFGYDLVAVLAMLSAIGAALPLALLLRATMRHAPFVYAPIDTRYSA